MMELIALPRLRMKQLQSLGEETVRICEPIAELKNGVKLVKTKLETFKQGMTRDKTSAKEKLVLDKARDRLISGFIHDVKAELYFPHTDNNTHNGLNEVWKVANKYGTKMVRLPQQEETVAIDNFLDELSQIDTVALEAGSLNRWLPLIKTANEKYKKKAQSYLEDTINVASVDSASSLAPELVSSLEALYALIFAHDQISPNDTLQKAYMQIKELIQTLA